MNQQEKAQHGGESHGQKKILLTVVREGIFEGWGRRGGGRGGGGGRGSIAILLLDLGPRKEMLELFLLRSGELRGDRLHELDNIVCVCVCVCVFVCVLVSKRVSVYGVVGIIHLLTFFFLLHRV